MDIYFFKCYWPSNQRQRSCTCGRRANTFEKSQDLWLDIFYVGL